MTEQEVQILILGDLAGCSSRMGVSEFFDGGFWTRPSEE